MMTGRWQKNHDEYCKWFLEIDDGRTVWFRSPRSLSTVAFTTDKDTLQEKLDRLGPDIMTKEFSLPVFRNLSKKYSLLTSSRSESIANPMVGENAINRTARTTKSDR